MTLFYLSSVCAFRSIFSANISTRLIILGQHLLLDETIWKQLSLSDSDLLFKVQWPYIPFMCLGPLLSNNKDLEHNTWHTLTSRSYHLSAWSTSGFTYVTRSSDFALYLWLYLIYKHHTLDTCSVTHCEWPHIFCSQCDLYFIVQWFCLVSPIVLTSKASYFGYLLSLTLLLTLYYL